MKRWKSQCFVTQLQKGHLITYGVFHLLEASHKVQPTVERKGSHKIVDSERQGSRDYVRSCLPQVLIQTHSIFMFKTMWTSGQLTVLYLVFLLICYIFVKICMYVVYRNRKRIRINIKCCDLWWKDFKTFEMFSSSFTMSMFYI